MRQTMAFLALLSTTCIPASSLERLDPIEPGYELVSGARFEIDGVPPVGTWSGPLQFEFGQTRGIVTEAIGLSSKSRGEAAGVIGLFFEHAGSGTGTFTGFRGFLEQVGVSDLNGPFEGRQIRIRNLVIGTRPGQAADDHDNPTGKSKSLVSIDSALLRIAKRASSARQSTDAPQHRSTETGVQASAREVRLSKEFLDMMFPEIADRMELPDNVSVDLSASGEMDKGASSIHFGSILRIAGTPALDLKGNARIERSIAGPPEITGEIEITAGLIDDRDDSTESEAVRSRARLLAMLAAMRIESSSFDTAFLGALGRALRGHAEGKEIGTTEFRRTMTFASEPEQLEQLLVRLVQLLFGADLLSAN